MVTNNELIEEYIQTRDLKPNTHTTLKSVLNHYSKFQDSTLEELIIEADNEEDVGLRWKRRTLKTRLINYINYCKKTMRISSVKSYLTIVKSFYYHHEIEIHKLPPINKRNANISEPITYKDLPDKDIIRYACDMCTPLMRSLILFLASTGMSKVDALGLTVQDFINATSDYHNGGSIDEVLTCLSNYEGNIIPTWTNRRSKTNKYYITFNTPECTDELLNYLIIRNNRQPLQPEDKLFKIHRDYYTKRFIDLNTIMDLGKVGTYNRFRGHMLRKFHSSNLEKAGMERYKINVLQGKSNGAVDDVYFFSDAETLKEDYVKYMDALLIFTEVKTFDEYSPEYLQMQKENELLQEEVAKVRQLEVDVEKIKSWYVFDD